MKAQTINADEVQDFVDDNMEGFWKPISDDNALISEVVEFYKACYNVRPYTYPQTRDEALKMVYECECFLNSKRVTDEGCAWLDAEGWAFHHSVR